MIKEKRGEEDYEKLWKSEFDFKELYKASIQHDKLPGEEQSYIRGATMNSVNSQE